MWNHVKAAQSDLGTEARSVSQRWYATAGVDHGRIDLPLPVQQPPDRERGRARSPRRAEDAVASDPRPLPALRLLPRRHDRRRRAAPRGSSVSAVERARRPRSPLPARAARGSADVVLGAMPYTACALRPPRSIETGAPSRAIRY